MNLEPRLFPARERAAVQVLIRWVFHRTGLRLLVI